MYLDWVLPCIAIIFIAILVYFIYNRTISEPFVISAPPQQYTIPELRGVPGRYVRIRPSTSGDGYLSISQIQVIDINGNNVALGKKVTATSSGGSPMDQKYGKSVLYGAVYTLLPGVGADPSVVVDGVTVPRRGLTNIFQTGNPNTDDTEYLEIDLLDLMTISSIIYSGRADPIKATYTTYEGEDLVDQVTRLTGMRVEVRDTNRALTFSTTFNDDPLTHIVTIPINTTLFTINPGASTAAITIPVPNVAGYKAISKPFTVTNAVADANASLIRAVHSKYTTVNKAAAIAAQSARAAAALSGVTDGFAQLQALQSLKAPTEDEQRAMTLQYSFDISGDIFQALSQSYPVGFYHDIYSIGCPALNCKANANTGRK